MRSSNTFLLLPSTKTARLRAKYSGKYSWPPATPSLMNEMMITYVFNFLNCSLTY